MPIGGAGDPFSELSQAYPDRVEVRGRDLTGDLMGRLSFTEYFYLLLTGEEPTADQRDFLDLLLVAIAEHGMMPTNVAARMTLAADPGSLQGAVAAGILGCGPVILGTAEECARLLERAQAEVDAGAAPDAAAAKLARRDPRGRRASCPASATRCTGRSTRAPSASSSSPTSAASRARTSRSPARFRDAVAEAWGRPLTHERLDADRGGDARPRLPGLGGQGGADPRPHRRACSPTSPRSASSPIGFLMAGAAEEAIEYEAPADEPPG